MLELLCFQETVNLEKFRARVLILVLVEIRHLVHRMLIKGVPSLDPHCLKLIEENMALLPSSMTAYENLTLGKLVANSSLDEDFDQIDQGWRN
ncbi:hypothetical protein Hanom_Chr01g00044271 [Helianthus anomalus]